MDRLTKKQEGFVLDIFSGMSQHDAYVKNYNASRMSPAVIDVKACELAKNGKITVRLAELREKAQNDKIASVKERKEILSEIARARQSDFMICSADGVWMHDVGNETMNTHAIKQIQTTSMPFGGNDSPLKILLTKVELHNPIDAIKELNKMDGVYSDSTQINISNRETKNTQIIIGDIDVAEALAILVNSGAVRLDSSNQDTTSIEPVYTTQTNS